MKVKTAILKRLVDKAVRGCSFNANVVITSILSLSCKNSKLYVTSTDMTNYISTYADIDCDDEFDITVPADVFSKLINKTTSEYVELMLNDSILIVKGNGKYSIELPLDENGDIFKFVNPGFDIVEGTSTSSLKELSIFQLMQHSLKPSLLPVNVDNVSSCYIKYYCGDNIIATDSEVVSSLAVKLLDEPVLLSAKLVDLICLSDDSKITVTRTDKCIVFNDKDLLIYSTTQDDITEYKTDTLNQLLSIPFDYTCAVSKSQIINTIDRLSLFMNDRLDAGIIRAEFTKDELKLSTINDGSVESIPYAHTIDCESYECNIGVATILPQLKAYSGDTVSIQFGSPDNNVIKLLDNGIQQLIALAI